MCPFPTVFVTLLDPPDASPTHIPTYRAAVVLGAGWLGWPLAESLVGRGLTVTTVRRSPHRPPDGATARSWDLTGSDLPHPLPTADLIVAAVAPDRGRGDDHAGTYPAAARAAVRLAHATGARTLVWVSSTGVYGITDGRWATEDTPPEGSGPSAAALLEAEQTVLDANSPTLVAGVLRACGLYGPERDPSPRYRDASALRGRADHFTNVIWRDDVISAVECWAHHAARHTDVPRIVNVADGSPLTVAACARLVREAHGEDTNDGAQLVADVTDPTRAPSATPPGAAASSAPSAPRSNQRIDTTRLRALGWTPSVPSLREGLRRLGYTLPAVPAAPYGPQTHAIRRYLQRLAGLDGASREHVLRTWESVQSQEPFQRADRLLGETIVSSGRETERDAAAGPLLRLVTRAGSVETDDAPSLDPLAEPALAGLLALLVRDLLPAASYDALTQPLQQAGVFDE